jgi:hypothetical protein
MNLNYKIDCISSIPHKIDEGIICLNSDACNLVYNMGTIKADKKTWNNSIGVWKIKQLKQ